MRHVPCLYIYIYVCMGGCMYVCIYGECLSHVQLSPVVQIGMFVCMYGMYVSVYVCIACTAGRGHIH